MRKTFALILILILTLLPGGAAGAGKRKTIKQSHPVTALPYPAPDYVITGRPCLSGVDGIHRIAIPFTAPASGYLSTTLEWEAGDWEFYLLNESGDVVLESHNDQTLDLAPPFEKMSYYMLRGEKVSLVACNWMGTINGLVTLTFKY